MTWSDTLQIAKSLITGARTPGFAMHAWPSSGKKEGRAYAKMSLLC
jgi:hypothetical protein